ncbi:hypothetical protein CcaverHIS002_0505900 [Cutaneotrichosporon cavernicola]|uniref:Ricin B lectin domain-containing protein n=1 Tax=Cutaneotrichosporon cavernicola TaxID=279322 RepID=A0AA48QWZ1_9TREE|nr:uncharacterized protein CcaverHIS019_0506420 [Cutaneotrichosporon cavernicola]BEI85189.1 hypothetical protein CcaverHIS002_0505900 [Cutaneotrichosporon cavernicola]BEI93014.1 hypothetical protein CcaverHIS019_0506420 [Cutaneotrichosporon cavernicola]
MLALLSLLLLVGATSIPDPGHELLRGTFGETSQCLSVKGGLLRSLTPVVITDCKGVQTQSWVVAHDEPGIVRVAGTRFCLDAGKDPMNGSKVTIRTCNSNAPEQNWFWTDDNRLALVGMGLCLDNTDGRDMNGNQVQVWSCTGGNTNQVWGAPDRGPCGPAPCTSFPFPRPSPRPSHRPSGRPSHKPRS